MKEEGLSIDAATRLLRVTRARIYQLAAEGVLHKRGPLLSLESVCQRIFRVEPGKVTYLPLEWTFRIDRPAVALWPVCGAKTYDDSASAVTDAIPAELQDDPELAAKIARLALDWANATRQH